MLYVKIKTKLDGRQSHQFHTGSGKEYLRELLRVDATEVESIQADNDELVEIHTQFPNLLRHCSARVQTYRGETAMFIFDHLKL